MFYFFIFLDEKHDFFSKAGPHYVEKHFIKACEKHVNASSK